MLNNTPTNAPMMRDEAVMCRCGCNARRVALIYKKNGERSDHYHCTGCGSQFNVSRREAL